MGQSDDSLLSATSLLEDYEFFLCNLEFRDKSLDHAEDDHDFSITKLAWAIQDGLSVKCIQPYLSRYADSITSFGLGVSLISLSGLSRFPILFVAVERNSQSM